MRRLLVVTASLLMLALPARAQQPSFIARVYPARVGVGEAFVVEVTLSLDDGRVDGYKPPEWKGARVISEQPSQSTQIQMGGGGSAVQTVYSWHYELEA
ncbi:MAG TPA: BatD family protein, partial [Polyangia bacterium]|nr:BatD family protein [Polyangia bacterium]